MLLGMDGVEDPPADACASLILAPLFHLNVSAQISSVNVLQRRGSPHFCCFLFLAARILGNLSLTLCNHPISTRRGLEDSQLYRPPTRRRELKELRHSSPLLRAVSWLNAVPTFKLFFCYPPYGVVAAQSDCPPNGSRGFDSHLEHRDSKWGLRGSVDKEIPSGASVDRVILSGATVAKWIEKYQMGPKWPNGQYCPQPLFGYRRAESRSYALVARRSRPRPERPQELASRLPHKTERPYVRLSAVVITADYRRHSVLPGTPLTTPSPLTSGPTNPGIFLGHKGRCGAAGRHPASHRDEPHTILCGVTPGFWHVGIVPDDADGRRIFPAISRFLRPLIPELLHTLLVSPSLAFKMTTKSLRSALRVFINKMIGSPLKVPQAPASTTRTLHLVQSPAHSGDGALVVSASVTLRASALLGKKKPYRQTMHISLPFLQTCDGRGEGIWLGGCDKQLTVLSGWREWSRCAGGGQRCLLPDIPPGGGGTHCQGDARLDKQGDSSSPSSACTSQSSDNSVVSARGGSTFPRTNIAPFTKILLGAAVVERLARSPLTKANRLQSPAGSPDFGMWESCRSITLVGGSSRGSRVSSAPSFRRCSILTLVILTVKSRPNLFTHENSREGNQSDPATLVGSPSTLGLTPLDKKHKTDLRKVLESEPLLDEMKRNNEKWREHLRRMLESRLPALAMGEMRRNNKKWHDI
ncbi:hypothetical protein PR048_025190 [Dryococelus australis]|uniref:Uncharacterized protein n=1 Tax=Dryococelus australis TaxID=614101 RepID=A0ABQ9GQR6_9NEOP|nr:hypothetical protein PR048_025190 [Dryococelus australis]